MEPADLMHILREIRDEIRKTNERIDETNEQTNKRIDGTNERLDAISERVDGMREELSRRIVESEIRTATAINALAGTVHEMTEFLKGFGLASSTAAEVSTHV